MYRFLLRPRWLAFHLLVAAGVVVMINLAFWQLRRHDERQAFNDLVTERIEQAPVGLDELLPVELGLDLDPAANDEPNDGRDQLAGVEWRPIEVTGEYLDDEQVRVFNRSQGGQAGDLVVTPMRLADGRVLLVARGFVPLDVAVEPPPPGDVSTHGRLRLSQERRRGQLTDTGRGEVTELQRLDIARLAAQLPGPVVPMYMELTMSDPAAAAGTYPVPVSPPELTAGPHLSYAVQWSIFALAAVAGWVFAVRKSLRSRTS